MTQKQGNDRDSTRNKSGGPSRVFYQSMAAAAVLMHALS